MQIKEVSTNMKHYFTPNAEIIFTEKQDIVCLSTGMSVGEGGDDINNWYWNTDPAAGERSNLPS